MQRLLLLILLFVFHLTNAFPYIRVSLLTSTPSNDEVYTVWGHSAVRVRTDSTDVVYNYGVFMFDDGFVYKFVRGETDYWLEKESMGMARVEAIYKNVDLYEQVLNLSEEEARSVYWLLEENSQPQNRSYRYNFFYDNCATRPRNLIEKALGGIEYPVWNSEVTYRDEVHRMTADCPWLQFGIDLCLGSPTDEEVGDYGLMFIPSYLHDAYKDAVKLTGDKLVQTETLVVSAVPSEKELVLSPLFLFSLLCVFVTFLTWRKYRKGGNGRWLDSLLFVTLGMVGCLLFFLTFFSTHPCVSPNFNLLWANPLQLLIPLALFVRKAATCLKGLLWANLFASGLVLAGWFVLPQEFHVANLPLILMSMGRSLYMLKKT